MKAKVQKLDGKASGDIELNDAVFGVDRGHVIGIDVGRRRQLRAGRGLAEGRDHPIEDWLARRRCRDAQHPGLLGQHLEGVGHPPGEEGRGALGGDGLVVAGPERDLSLEHDEQRVGIVARRSLGDGQCVDETGRERGGTAGGQPVEPVAGDLHARRR